MRVPLLLLALILLATFAWPSMQRDEPPPAISWIEFDPVPLFRETPLEKRLGRLLFLGGWALTSNDRRVGGISALHVAEGEALAVGDAGYALRFPLPQRPGRVRASVQPLMQGPGQAGPKINRDVESLAVLGPRAWIAFEQANAIWRYRRSDWKAEAAAQPAALRKWPSNRGAEAMVRLRDGRFLVFAEGAGGDSRAVLFGGDPAEPGTPTLSLTYRPPAGFRITDAAVLPDGKLLFLNRRASILDGFNAVLTMASLPPLRPGVLISGEEVAAFKRPAVRENFEALSVTSEKGRTMLWLASDDNYNGLQRTLLLKFQLAP